MSNNSEQNLTSVTSKGWDSELVNTMIELAGGYGPFEQAANSVSGLLFTNSMATRPDLSESEPSILGASVITAHMDFLDKSKAAEMADFFTDNQERIAQSIINYAAHNNQDPVIELTHNAQALTDDEISHVFNGGALSDDAKLEVTASVYSMLLSELVGLTGGLDAYELLELDLSKVDNVTITNSQVVIESKPKTKNIGFMDEEIIGRIHAEHNIDFGYHFDGTSRYINSLCISRKDKGESRLPLRLAFNELIHVLAKGRSFLEAHVTHKSDNKLSIHCADNTVADLFFKVDNVLDLNLSDDSNVAASGEAGRINLLAGGNSYLLATRLWSDFFWSACSDNCTVVVDCENFTDDNHLRTFSQTVVNNAITEDITASADFPDFMTSFCNALDDISNMGPGGSNGDTK